MSKWVRLTALMMAFAVVAVPATVSVAQDAKKEVKKDDKKKDTKKAPGKIEIGEGKDGKFRFSVRDADGKYLGGSGPIGYPTKADAVKAIETLKEVIATAKVVDAPKDEKKDK